MLVLRQVGVYPVRHMKEITVLANVNRSGSFSLITFPRYVVDGETGEMQDVMEEEERELVKYAFPDQWTVINLRQLAELSIRDHIRLDKNTWDYIRKYDAMVIPPATEYAKEIRWKDQSVVSCLLSLV